MAQSIPLERKGVFLIIPSLGIGGAEHALFKLYRLLAQQYDVTLITFGLEYGKGFFRDIEVITLKPEKKIKV